MPKRLSKGKRPTDVNRLAHQLVRESTEPREEQEMPDQKPTRAEISRIMAAMGRKGGKKSAKARMEKITPHERSRIALKAAQARWAKEQEKRS
jgi:hypothetical protein